MLQTYYVDDLEDAFINQWDMFKTKKKSSRTKLE